MAAHAPLPPSSASEWTECPLSVRMHQYYGGETSEDAEAGQQAHAEGAECVLSGKISSNPDVAVYVNHIRNLAPTLTYWGVETTLPPLPHLQSVWGTCDFWGYDSSTRTVHLIDYKHGHGYVDEWENLQLRIYAMLWQAHAKLPIDMYALTIVQPRYYQAAAVRTYRTNDINQPWIESRARFALENPEVAHAGKHCRNCPGDKYCKTNAEYIARYMDLAEIGGTVDLDDEKLGKEILELQTAVKLMESRLTSLQEAAISKIKSGRNVANLALQHGAGRRNWSISQREVVALGKAYGVDLSKPDVRTPKQAEDAGVPPEIVKLFCESTPGEAKLVPWTLERVMKNV